MLEKFINIIEKHKIFKKGDKVIVGVSGGPDSMCLLYLLNELKKDLDIKLIVAHVNYGIRGKDSDQDEILVKRSAKKFKLNLKILRVNPDKLPKRGNLEENLRSIRYKFFDKLLKKEKADYIAIAHNKNDLAETMLMFFLRGSGLKGLSSLKYKQGNLIRPLLDFTKQEIIEYLKKEGINYHIDKSNMDLKYTRNRIRYKLMPQLIKKYNPNLIDTLALGSRTIADDYNFLASFSKHIYHNLAQKNKGEIVINLNQFIDLFPALQRELIRIIFEEFEVELRNISLLDIEELLRVVREGKNGSYRAIKGLRFEKKSGSIVVSKMLNKK